MYSLEYTLDKPIFIIKNYFGENSYRRIRDLFSVMFENLNILDDAESIAGHPKKVISGPKLFAKTFFFYRTPYDFIKHK